MTNREIIETLEMALQWLDNIEAQHSLDLLIDAMPNNCHGRFAIRDAIMELMKRWSDDQS